MRADGLFNGQVFFFAEHKTSRRFAAHVNKKGKIARLVADPLQGLAVEWRVLEVVTG